MTSFQFQDIDVSVTPTNDTKQWYMTVEQAAEAYGRARTVIMDHLRNHADEIREGVEKGVGIFDTLGGPQKQTVLYREGVIKLGFFIRSPRAAAFRQFATDLVVKNLVTTGQDDADKFAAVLERLERLDNICRGIRDEVDELRATLNLLISEDEENIIRGLIKKIKDAYNCDGRRVVGMVRQTLNVGSIYSTPDTRKVIDVLKNILGEGLRLVKPEPKD